MICVKRLIRHEGVVILGCSWWQWRRLFLQRGNTCIVHQSSFFCIGLRPLSASVHVGNQAEDLVAMNDNVLLTPCQLHSWCSRNKVARGKGCADG